MKAQIYGIDPGPERSGMIVLLDGRVVEAGYHENEELILAIAQIASPGFFNFPGPRFAIEDVEPTSVPFGNILRNTTFWLGRFVQATHRRPVALVRPSKIRPTLCGGAVQGVTRTHVKSALVDEFGGDPDAFGGKRCAHCNGRGRRGRGKAIERCEACAGVGVSRQGPLWLLGNHQPAVDRPHLWSALAVAVAAQRLGLFEEERDDLQGREAGRR